MMKNIPKCLTSVLGLMVNYGLTTDDASEQVKCEVMDGGPVDVLTKEYQGRIYFFAVNNDFKSVRVRFTLPTGIKASEAHIYEEQQKIIVQNGVIEDTLGELGVRIYWFDR